MALQVGLSTSAVRKFLINGENTISEKNCGKFINLTGINERAIGRREFSVYFTAKKLRNHLMSLLQLK